MSRPTSRVCPAQAARAEAEAQLAAAARQAGGQAARRAAEALAQCDAQQGQQETRLQEWVAAYADACRRQRQQLLAAVCVGRGSHRPIHACQE